MKISLIKSFSCKPGFHSSFLFERFTSRPVWNVPLSSTMQLSFSLSSKQFHLSSTQWARSIASQLQAHPPPPPGTPSPTPHWAKQGMWVLDRDLLLTFGSPQEPALACSTPLPSVQILPPLLPEGLGTVAPSSFPGCLQPCSPKGAQQLRLPAPQPRRSTQVLELQGVTRTCHLSLHPRIRAVPPSVRSRPHFLTPLPAPLPPEPPPTHSASGFSFFQFSVHFLCWTLQLPFPYPLTWCSSALVLTSRAGAARTLTCRLRPAPCPLPPAQVEGDCSPDSLQLLGGKDRVLWLCSSSPMPSDTCWVGFLKTKFVLRRDQVKRCPSARTANPDFSDKGMQPGGGSTPGYPWYGKERFGNQESGCEPGICSWCPGTSCCTALCLGQCLLPLACGRGSKKNAPGCFYRVRNKSRT